MSGAGAAESTVAAHEYAHLMWHTAGLQLPPWLEEGLADFFSTIRIRENSCIIGGDLPSRSQTLQRSAWMPLSQLLALPPDAALRDDREKASLFYAQSWALVQMLVLSPQYSPNFPRLLAVLGAGTTSAQALTTVYFKSLDEIAHDVQAASSAHLAPIVLHGVAIGRITVQTSTLSPFETRLVIADLLFASGKLDRAATLYRDLAREAPGNPDISAALGTIAFRRGDRAAARKAWKRAIDNGTTDAALCYRYAALAQDSGIPAAELRPVFERAIALKPDFDDAQYALALLESNTGDFSSAIAQLHAMRNVSPTRAYTYWSVLAYAFTEIGERENAKAAAQQAARYAQTATERANAAQLAYVADTDLAVQFTRDANGRPQLMTTRVPHNTQHWNAFIEPGDKIRRVSAKLREISCQGDRVTGVSIDTSEGPLTLLIPDPSRVLMTNAPLEFTCGVQPSNPVNVEFAVAEASNADGVLRGMEFAK
jgi:tetratricopeptide (TPR) repeat protein